MEIVFNIQSTCRQYTTTLNVRNVRGGKSAVSERWMEKVQSSGSVLTNSILCCCSCFHGALSPSLLLSHSLSLPLHCLSLSLTRTHAHAHTSVWKRIQLCESICNQPQLRERGPLILSRQTFHLSSISPESRPSHHFSFFNLITIISSFILKPSHNNKPTFSTLNYCDADTRAPHEQGAQQPELCFFFPPAALFGVDVAISSAHYT